MSTNPVEIVAMTSASTDSSEASREKLYADEIGRRVVEAIRGLRFGSVEIVIHEGKIVQFERRERVRVDRNPPIDHRSERQPSRD